MTERVNDVLGTINRGNPAESGLCTLCRADCQGKCETWLSSIVGRKLLYPRDFGTITAGALLKQQSAFLTTPEESGYNYGAEGLPRTFNSRITVYSPI